MTLVEWDTMVAAREVRDAKINAKRAKEKLEYAAKLKYQIKDWWMQDRKRKGIVETDDEAFEAWYTEHLREKAAEAAKRAAAEEAERLKSLRAWVNSHVEDCDGRG
jgi:hypothetical protein